MLDEPKAFLRAGGIELVSVHKAGCYFLKISDKLLCFRYSQIVLQRLGRRGWVQSLPQSQSARGWIAGKQVVQQRCAGPREAKDVQRLLNRCLRHLRVRGKSLLS